MKGNKGGRPKAKVNWKVIEAACKMQCTQEEIASLVGVCVDTLDAHCKEKHSVSFSDFFKEKRLGGKASLRRNQWLMAQKIPTMAIWLGKQYLDQSDKSKDELQVSEIKINIDGDDSKL